MKKYIGGNKVDRGYYMNVNTAEFVMPEDGTLALPGTAEDSFVKVPAFVPALAAPVFGLGFVIILPLAGIIAILGFLAYKLGLVSTNIGRRVLAPVLSGARHGRGGGRED